ncbi:MAG: MFS transporter [Deltaproteobacteria bacterium]|nr:MAG: MFS transporter [Deltaproteobacteria bacterium]
MKNRLTISKIISQYFDKRLLWVFFMGCASGFPWVLIGSNMFGWLKDSGLSKTDTGLFGSIFTIYAVNFLWAPLVDRVKLPFLTRNLGQIRGWILLAQFCILLATLALTLLDPGHELKFVLIAAMLIAFASATQDIAVDAFRIDSFGIDEKSKLPMASAMGVIGWWTGYSLPGYLAFTNADACGWNGVYQGMAGLVCLLMLMTLLVPEPVTDRARIQKEAEARFTGKGSLTAWLAVTVYEPFAEFFRRNGSRLALTLILFIFLFKIGEAFLGRMSIPFYKEIGFSNQQIGYYSKLIGWGVTIFFTIVGSIVNVKFGIVRGLLIGGIAMAGSNLMFAWLAAVGPNEQILLAAIIVDNFTSAFATIAFVSFLTFFTGRGFTATQYALLASVGNFGRTSLASFSGMVAEWLGSWAMFFTLTKVMVVPSLLLLLSLRPYFKDMDEL